MINTREIQKLNIDVRYYLQDSDKKRLISCLSYMKHNTYKYLKINLSRGYVIITMLTNGICNMIYRNRFSRTYMDRNINFRKLYRLVYNNI